MTIAPPLKITPPVTLPDAAFLKEKAASDHPVIIYQSYLDQGQKAHVCPGAVPLDIAFNKGGTSREYELFQLLHAHHKTIGLGDDAFWGSVSWKFELKAPTPFSDFLAEAEAAHRFGFDCYAYNPLIGNFSIYANVWEQGRVGHGNMRPIIDYMLQRGLPLGQPQGLSSFFFCNYVCGNERFWSSYFSFCENILGDLEEHARRGTPVGIAYAGSANYGRSPELTMRPFVIERLLGLFLQSAVPQGLKLAVYTPTKEHFDDKFGSRLANSFYPLYLKKIAMAETRTKEAFDDWNKARLSVFESPMLACHADDPPPWVLNR